LSKICFKHTAGFMKKVKNEDTSDLILFCAD